MSSMCTLKGLSGTISALTFEWFRKKTLPIESRHGKISLGVESR